MGFFLLTLAICAGQEPFFGRTGRIFLQPAGGQRASRQSVLTESVATERRWTPPGTNGRATNLNGNIAWKEQLISRDEERTGELELFVQ
jgi:hypothetical protein